MTNSSYRGWEYAKKGDYHRDLDPNWSYTPTYLRKMHYIRTWLDELDHGVRILDVGCGEGVLVEEYVAKGLSIEGLDLNYESQWVKRGDILDMPYPDDSLDVVLLLDVFEHLAFLDQPRAIKEIRRILKPGGLFLASIPNLAHLNSRLLMLLRGRLDRTDNEINHLGERPFKENESLLMSNGFQIIKIKGITLTVPWVYRHIICRQPVKYLWLHDWLENFAIPSLAMLNVFVCKNSG